MEMRSFPGVFERMHRTCNERQLYLCKDKFDEGYR